jgi:UDP-N-acetyl-2-amino-2-deoxyglucuronate dehydrogenase
MLEQVSPYRVGIVGCGRIARHHLEAFRLLDEFTVTAVCDEIPERVAEAAEANGAACFTDYSQFLAEAPVDVIDICTPSGLHAEMGIAAARTGRHVITEKPMALDMGSADRLVEACRAHHVGLYVVMQNRLNTTMKLLKRAVEKGRFGRIYMANATVRWHRPQSYYDAASWRGTRKLVPS